MSKSFNPIFASQMVAQMSLTYLSILKDRELLSQDEFDVYDNMIHIALRSYDYDTLSDLARQLSENMLSIAAYLDEN